eukprot:TRINITY_DN1090_c0_g1_i2.p1 TRINITY_DN1090_c0_g1~~TRINITY_DN1090_c0_g1_i2.p1  ORF type:complete len:1513 (-),score=329.80 TRINITY_DN1090_c0_g1_i2:464-5002(-)
MGREIDLIVATQKGNISAIKRLLGATKKGVFRNKISPNFQDARGYTPLHHAIMYGQKESLLVLLRYGADPRISDRSGNYPLHTACQQGDYDSLKLLIEHSPIRPEIDQQNANDDTSLIIAAQEGMYTLVEFLIRAGADPHKTNKLDHNCLELASYYGRKDVVNLLLRRIPGILDTPHSTNHTCLHFAARNGHNSILQLLMDKGFSINTMCKTGSCLHEAALHGRVETVAYVLDRNIDIYLTNSHGQTVLEAMQSLASSLGRSRIQQLISDHICHKLNLGNRRNSQSYHNNLSSHSSGFRIEDVDDPNGFQRSSSFNLQPTQDMFSNTSQTLSDSFPNSSSYSTPYQQLTPRDPPTSKSQNPQVLYSNDAILYARKPASDNKYFDDDVTHAPLSVIRKPNTNLPVSLQGNGIYYYKTPSAKFNPPQEEIQSLPADFNPQQSDRKRDSCSSDDYILRQERNRNVYEFGDMAQHLLQTPDIITSESDLDEVSVASSSHNSYNNLGNLFPKRSVPIVQMNPAHSLFADMLSDETSDADPEIIQNFQDNFNKTLGIPSGGTYIPLNERSASVLGCSETIDRKEFVKKSVKHPLENLEDSSSRIVIRNRDRVTYYPSTETEHTYSNMQGEDVRSSSPSVSSSHSRASTSNYAYPSIPVQPRSFQNTQGTPSNLIPYSSQSEKRPFIANPIINKPRKSVPLIHLIAPTTDDSGFYPDTPPNPILRNHSTKGRRGRFNTYHEGDCDQSPVKYSNDIVHSSPMNRSSFIPQSGRKSEKPPPGKPRGSKGYQSGNLTSDTSRSTSPSFSDTHSRPKYFQESRYSPVRSPAFFQSEEFQTYKVPLHPESTSGEDTPQERLDHKSESISSLEDLSMSLQVDNVFVDTKIQDRNKTLTREEPPADKDDIEWESIENVMDMVVQISSEIESGTSTELTSFYPISVPDLLQNIDLAHRASLFMNNGFDDLGFLAVILTQDDLIEIGIEDISEIQHILAAVSLLPAPEINTKPSSVSQWLIQIGLHQLYHLFSCKGYNTIDDVCHLWDIHLTTVLEIHQLGYRRRIMYSLSRIRAASPERNFTPSDSDFYSPPYSLASFSDKSFPMDSPSTSSVPPPPPRKDSYTVTQELWSYYDKNVTHSYPRDSSRNERLNSHRSPPNPQKTSPPPLPPKGKAVRSTPDSKRPKPLPKPVLGDLFMKKSSSSNFSVASSRPPLERIGPTGEIQEMQKTKQSYSQLGEELKNTVNLMSDNTKESLISYLAECLQPRVMNSNDNRTSPALYQPPAKDNPPRSSNYTRSGNKVDLEIAEFTVSPIYQRIEETGENLPPETGFNRSDRRYHSMMTHSTPSQLRNKKRTSKHIPGNESIASFYEGEKKANSDQKKHRFGKFRSSKKVVRTNPVYESSSVLQGLPENTDVPVTVNQVSKPNIYTSSSIPSSSRSFPPSSSSGNDYPASRISIRSPVVLQQETMGTNLDNHLKDQSQKLWVHPVNKLTSGSISYTVRYMGTAVVSSLVGKETINDTCRRIKVL